MRRPRIRTVLAATALLSISALAFARVGGGEGFSTGSGGGGFGGRGGGGGGGGELMFLVIQLCLLHPMIGIPVCLFALWYVATHAQDGGPVRRSISFDANPTVGAPDTSGWDALKATDPALSEPVFHDFAQLVFRRAYAATPHGPWEPLAPFLARSAQTALVEQAQGLTGYDDVVVAGTTLVSAQAAGTEQSVVVAFTSSRVEKAATGAVHLYTEERWTFARSASARSLPPDDTVRLGCPSCGAAIQCDAMGACKNCGTPITAGQLQWQVRMIAVSVRRPVTPPTVEMFEGGEEESYRSPSVLAPDLATQLRSFHGRHPGFDTDAFQKRAYFVFTSLQSAWDAGRWDDARPFVTDAAWGTLRFWIDRYRAGGLRNRLADVKIARMQVVKITLDAWYESITVRFWASTKDWVEDAHGHVVGGNKDRDRLFTEYWTFLRAVGSGDTSKDPSHCPSCGAPLDKVNAAGKCGYCDSVITTGHFDWVLTRIDQAEVYRG